MDVKSNNPLVNVSTQADINAQSARLISELPNEMFRAILSRVQLPHVIRFRSVDKRWKVAIEDICRDKKCLVLNDWDNHYLSTLSNRFNGHLKLSHDFVFIQLKSIQLHRKMHMSANLCPILTKLFPQIEQFFTNVGFSHSSPEFILMLRQWSPTLTTLSLSYRIAESLCAQLNNMPNLRQLNLDTFEREIANQLTPALNRLEHFSCCGYESSKMASLLQTRITSLGLIYPTIVTLKEITNWRNLNAQFVSSLERLSLVTNDPQVLPFICEHLSSLRMLRINNVNVGPFNLTNNMFVYLARLTHLTELRFDFVVIDLSTLNVAKLRPLLNIRNLSLVNFAFVKYVSGNFVDHFGRLFSTIFPNVNKLTIKSRFYKELEYLLESHANLFPNLHSHEFSLYDPMNRLMDYL